MSWKQRKMRRYVEASRQLAAFHRRCADAEAHRRHVGSAWPGGDYVVRGYATFAAAEARPPEVPAHIAELQREVVELGELLRQVD